MELIYLIVVGRDYAYVVIPRQRGKDFLTYHIYLTLVILCRGMVALSGKIGTKHILLAMVVGHDDQVASIELLIAEIDDAWMASVVFTEHGLGHIPDDSTDRLQETVLGTVIPIGDMVLLHDGSQFGSVFFRYHIGQLERIADYHGIVCTSESQGTSLYRHL